ncbi:hypothetical protein M438DRAFT_372820 [Aureobasidium pullulans EXF-150]|uniref:Uncharacterized protein n=1 Tax=Aureobasidium pullulans EXF-150 TaxID=1043002 RepID=A0A074XZ99_AURPU|nr:uncharacterized protein M438DRAFT_372820 [Aureobasidium pullulans EXF-150]KEQ87302.1 hypothetical protein M438DRAFT_372820 [Aureobasidium pullulans EXF-150]
MASNLEQASEVQRRQEKSEQARQRFLDSIARSTDYDWIMQNIRFGIEYPQQVYLQHGMKRTDEQLESQLKQTWWKTVEAAKLYPADDDGRQYKLIAWVAGARARGTVPSTTQDAYVADGGKVLWKDLPFFEGALENAWADEANLSKEKWTNLNAFASGLAQVTGMDLMQFGLQTIKATLEEPRLVSSGNVKSQAGHKSVADLLPAAIFWLGRSYSFFKVMLPIIERAVNEGKHPPTGCGSGIVPGELALAGGVTRDGLSLARQRFWRHRLIEIGQQPTQASGGNEGERDTTAETALEWSRRMATWTLNWPIDMKDVPGYEEPIEYKKDGI